MLIEYEQLLYYKGFMERCQYIFESREWGGAYGAVGIAVGSGAPFNLLKSPVWIKQL